ncbi:MAG: family 2 encapsulin nanocompartment cargo protein polyprenyl transferase [Micromonosporaceae bacterium]
MSTETTAGYRTAADVLAESRDTVQPSLRAAVDSLPAPIRHVTGYHLGWWDERGRPEHAHTGKALRPTLVLLAAEAVGGTPEPAVPAAVAVELVHNFSLLHDDVMDGDATRRHRPTAWRVFGLPAAILAGDALLALASDVLAAPGHPSAGQATRMLSAAVLDLVAGQTADVAFERRDVGLRECQDMAEGKTAALFGAACGLGALYGDGRPDQVERLRAYGRSLGLAFQHVDDLLGIWGDPSVTGKPVHSDLAGRKKSLPVVAALTSGTAAGRELSAIYRTAGDLTDLQVVRAAELVDLAGGRTWSQAEASRLVDHARHQLAAADPSPRVAAELDNLSELVTRRDH